MCQSSNCVRYRNCIVTLHIRYRPFFIDPIMVKINSLWQSHLSQPDIQNFWNLTHSLYPELIGREIALCAYRMIIPLTDKLVDCIINQWNVECNRCTSSVGSKIPLCSRKRKMFKKRLTITWLTSHQRRSILWL